MAAFLQNGADLFCTEYLIAIVINLLYFDSEFLPALLVQGLIPLVSVYVIIKCSAGNIQCFTKKVNAILAVQCFQGG